MNIDPLFVYALNHSADVKRMVGKRIYVTERTQAQIEEDAIPYCLIHFDGAACTTGDKDRRFNRPDMATVSILCVAETRKGVNQLVEAVVDAVGDVVDGDQYDDIHIDGMQVKYEEAQADNGTKVCHYQWLTFECEI